MTLALIFAALSMGLLGSPHCLGMCGGIVAAFGLSMQNQSFAKKSLLMAGYHLGRLGSYLMLGLLASSLGKHILAPLMANGNIPKCLLGGSLVFAALLMLGLPALNRIEKVGLGLWNTLAPIRAKVLPMDNLPKAIAAGLLWGFLPCGLVYGALGVALSLSADASFGVNALGFMAFFWLGTLPMLLATGSLIHWLRSKIAAFHLRKFSGVVMLISGLAIAFSGPIMHAVHGGHSGHGDHAMHGSDGTHTGDSSHAMHTKHSHDPHSSQPTPHHPNNHSAGTDAHDGHSSHANHSQHAHH